MRRWFFLLLALSAGSIFLVPRCLALPPQKSDAGRKVVNKVSPIYPALARQMRLAGSVKIMATVGPDGTPKGTEVLGGHPLLTQAAVNAVLKWKWAAAPEETKELIELKFNPD